MRIGCLQFAPVKADVGNNLSRADAVLARADTESLDLIVLPEMAFTGYNFSSLREITQHLEPSGTGITSIWARTTALRHGCTVVCPYPEKTSAAGGPRNCSSAVVVNKDGKTVGHYRKTHLYATDEAWAAGGTRGFYHDELPGLGSVAMGLSVDLNPHRFETPWHAFELASHALEARASLLLVPMAWPAAADVGLSFNQSPRGPDMDALMYWVSRLEPLIRAEAGGETVVVFANRAGGEGGVVYAGTSAVLGIREGEVKVYGLLGRSDRELLVVDTEAEPYARLVYRPQGVTAQVGARGFYGDKSPMESIPEESPLPPSQGMQNSPLSPSTLGSPMTDSDAPAANEPATPATASLPSPFPVPTRVLPQFPRPLPPRLSLQTGSDILKSCTCTPTSQSATTSFCISPDHVIDLAETTTARHDIDSKVHRPTPHPLVSWPSPEKLFQRAMARLKGMVTTTSPAGYSVPRGGGLLGTSESIGARSDMASAGTSASAFGPDRASARSGTDRFNGRGLSPITSGGGQPGPNVSSARSAQSRPSPPWSRGPSENTPAAPPKRTRGTEDEVRLDAVAQGLQSAALSISDEEDRDDWPLPRGASIPNDRRCTPAEPHRRPRDAPTSATENLSYGAGVGSGWEARPGDVCVDGSGALFDAGAARIGDSLTRIGGKGKEPRRSPRIGEASGEARPPHRSLPIPSKQTPPPRRSPCLGDASGEARPPHRSLPIPSRPTPPSHHSWSPARSGPPRQSAYKRVEAPKALPSRATYPIPHGRARAQSLLPRGRGAKMAPTSPGDEGVPDRGDQGLVALGLSRTVHGLPTPGCSPTEVGAPGWI